MGLATTSVLQMGVATTSVLQAAAAQRGGANEQEALAGFTRSIEGYAQLHRRLEGPVPTVRISEDLGEVQRAIAALAQKIRAARPDARQGDIFTPEVAAIFKRRIGEAIKNDYRTLREMVDEENPQAGKMRPRLNAPYPVGAPVSLMPTEVLDSLPPLPDDLQFRFMDRYLILWDAHANLIVDYFPDAIPGR
jgi:hypothetical protein